MSWYKTLRPTAVISEIFCYVCFEEFESISQLSLHQNNMHENLVNSKSQDFKECKVCDHRLPLDKQKHLLKCEARFLQPRKPGESYSCSKCPKSYGRGHRRYIHNHIQSEHLKLRFQCSMCDTIRNSKLSLLGHFQSIHKGKTKQCKQCKYFSTKNMYLKLHIEKQHEGLRYKCKRCTERFTTTRDKKKHFRNAHLKSVLFFEKTNSQEGNKNNMLTCIKDLEKGEISRIEEGEIVEMK